MPFLSDIKFGGKVLESDIYLYFGMLAPIYLVGRDQIRNFIIT